MKLCQQIRKFRILLSGTLLLVSMSIFSGCAPTHTSLMLDYRYPPGAYPNYYYDHYYGPFYYYPDYSYGIYGRYYYPYYYPGYRSYPYYYSPVPPSGRGGRTIR